jgi:hypothetical protein
MAQQSIPRLGRLHRPAAEQGHAEVALERGDLLRHRGLGAADLLGRR